MVRRVDMPAPVKGRQALFAAKRIVVKIGTGALTHETGRFNRDHFERLADDLLVAAKGRELVVVSSGAIALGVERLGYPKRPADIPGKQACAAVGQSRLMQAYEEAFGRRNRTVAQVLLTHGDVQDRRRYLNAKHTLERLISEEVIPIINENDTVSVAEIKFGDNDTLAGLVASLVGAEALIILSDVEGLFEADPRKVPGAKQLIEIHKVDDAILSLCGASAGKIGVGGMATKVRAAAKVMELGIRCVITSGNVPGRLGQVLAGEPVGTLFEPQSSRRTAKTAWIAHALYAKGRLTVDEGAKRAMIEDKRSLLPKGIQSVEGTFEKGDPVDLVSGAGATFARGLVAYSSEEIRAIAGRKSSEIEKVLGYRYLDEVVHRDDLAIL